MAFIEDQNLIFLISQPRSGSSLLQQLILQSEEIESVPEPWFLLSLVHMLKKPGIEQGYNPNYAVINTQHYLSLFDNGEGFLRSRIKDLAKELYGLAYSGKSRYFMDKTPRYYHIINDLYDLFPQAKFVFLVRNPMAVFLSILDYNFKGNITAMLSATDRIDDLYLAPIRIAEALSGQTNLCLVRYEEIVESPKSSLNPIFDYLNLSSPITMGTYTLDGHFRAERAVDRKSLSRFTAPDSSVGKAWRDKVSTRERYNAIRDMLVKLQAVLPQIGYDYNVLRQDLDYLYNNSDEGDRL
jgi:hypothetical protein